MATVDFAAELLNRSSPITQLFMREVPKSIKHALGVVDGLQHKFSLERKSDPRDLFNQYMDAIFACSMLKNAQLNTAIIFAANNFDFLTYALAGRALIENTATLKYFSEKKLRPTVDRCVAEKEVSYERLKKMIDTADTLLRGSRFDWLNFFQNGFQKLSLDYADWLTEKKKNKSARKWKANSMSEQINVQTCLESWATEDARIGVIYDLFCDMVHPNIGSTLCLMTSDQGGGLRFRTDLKNCFGVNLFDMSYAPLQSLVGKEFAEQIRMFPLLKFE